MDEINDLFQQLVSQISILEIVIKGMIIGIVSDGKLPWGEVGTHEYESFFLTKINNVSGSCMSPVAMLLTGITIGRTDILALIKKWRIYLTSAIRLLVYPLAMLGVLLLLPQNSFFTLTFFKCAMCMASMPMGLNAIVVTAGYGKDTTDAAGLALISHLFSIGTIPLMFMMLEILIVLKNMKKKKFKDIW